MTVKTTRRSSRPSRRLSRRGDTRAALIEGAFVLLDGNKSFDGLSLRELTREVGIVPTGFYRHFTDMNALGVALVDEAFRTLRSILADVRRDTASAEHIPAAVVASLVKHIHAQRMRFGFIASERFGGNAGVRAGIRREMRLIQTELAVDLARLPYLKTWPAADLHMVAALLVNTLVAVAQEILEARETDADAEPGLVRLAEQQLRLILLGIPHWKTAQDDASRGESAA